MHVSLLTVGVIMCRCGTWTAAVHNATLKSPYTKVKPSISVKISNCSYCSYLEIRFSLTKNT
jgi:hypothetical protein